MNLESIKDRLKCINEKLVYQNEFHKRLNNEILQNITENSEISEEDCIMDQKDDGKKGLLFEINLLLSYIENQLNKQHDNNCKLRELILLPKETSST